MEVIEATNEGEQRDLTDMGIIIKRLIAPELKHNKQELTLTLKYLSEDVKDLSEKIDLLRKDLNINLDSLTITNQQVAAKFDDTDGMLELLLKAIENISSHTVNQLGEFIAQRQLFTKDQQVLLAEIKKTYEVMSDKPLVSHLKKENKRLHRTVDHIAKALTVTDK